MTADCSGAGWGVLAVSLVLLSGTGVGAQSPFRIPPYLQNPAPDGMTVFWFTDGPGAGVLSLEQNGRALGAFTSAPVLAYPVWEADTFFGGDPPPPPYRHRVRLSGLAPGSSYAYTVAQGAARFTSRFRTPPEGDGPIRFIVYGDSETEPESTGKRTRWPDAAGEDPDRLYLLDQTVGYANNLAVIRSREPAFVAIAGDLVESGGEQRDWTSSGAISRLWMGRRVWPGKVPYLAAPGNHEYYQGPQLRGYDQPGSKRAIARFRTYFEFRANGAADPLQEGRYFRVDYGPITLIGLDVANGSPHQSERDTNFFLLGEGDPDGVRALTPLFLRYGVDAVLAGHDEIWEHSEIAGEEVGPNGLGRSHTVHFYDVGIGGDGLRGLQAGLVNPFQRFLAHRDAPEVWEEDVLVAGGKHYGHLEVDVLPLEDGRWQAVLKPVYILPPLRPGRGVRRVRAAPVRRYRHPDHRAGHCGGGRPDRPAGPLLPGPTLPQSVQQHGPAALRPDRGSSGAAAGLQRAGAAGADPGPGHAGTRVLQCRVGRTGPGRGAGDQRYLPDRPARRGPQRHGEGVAGALKTDPKGIHSVNPVLLRPFEQTQRSPFRLKRPLSGGCIGGRPIPFACVPRVDLLASLRPLAQSPPGGGRGRGAVRGDAGEKPRSVAVPQTGSTARRPRGDQAALLPVEHRLQSRPARPAADRAHYAGRFGAGRTPWL